LLKVGAIEVFQKQRGNVKKSLKIGEVTNLWRKVTFVNIFHGV